MQYPVLMSTPSKLRLFGLISAALTLISCGGPEIEQSSSSTSSTSQAQTSSAQSSSVITSSASTSSSSPVQSSSAPVLSTLTLQPDDASKCSFLGVMEQEHTGFSGSGYFNSTNEIEADISFAISTATAQQISLSVSYANGGESDRAASLSVNGTSSQTISFASTSDWTNWQSAEVSIALEPGDNLIRLAANSTQGLANIDSLEAYGENLEKGDCEVASGDSWTSTVPYSVSGQDGIHDPSTILKDGDRYWTFGTGIGADNKPINALYSYDLINWTGGPSPIPANTYPSWINTKLPVFDGNFWAPDLIKMNGKYYLYYSAFSSDVLNSAIGVMVSDSLNNPNWQDLGMVVSTQDEPRSSQNQPVNAIDAGVYRDANGRVWMTYGSHYAGVFIREINPTTGLLMNDTRYNAAGNNGGWNEYEAAQVHYQNGFYYLFVNLGDCCVQLESDYIMYVGRSQSPTGPFITQSGHDLWQGDVISQQQVDAGVTTGSVLSTQPGFVGPGHFGYLNNHGQDLVSIHYYGGNDGWGHLRLLEMTFVNGWPVLDYNFQLRQ